MHFLNFIVKIGNSRSPDFIIKACLILLTFFIIINISFQYYNRINSIYNILLIANFSSSKSNFLLTFSPYKPNISSCFLEPQKPVVDYKNVADFNHSSYMKYMRCILDHDLTPSPIESKSGLFLIVDSECPLGIEIAHHLRKSGIDHLDIRGSKYLNLIHESGQKILSQFHITRSLIVCDSHQSRYFRSNYTSYSAIKTISADFMIDIPHPIFGHIRGKHSSRKEEDLYYQCLTKKVTKIEERKNQTKIDERYVLATEASKYILRYLNLTTLKEPIEIQNYSYEELHKKFYSHCIERKNDHLIESLLESCKSFPPQDNKEKTLSIVTTLSLDERYTNLANQTLSIFEHYLQNYPPNHLLLEIILVSIDTPEKHIEDMIKIGMNTKNYLKIIRINQKVYSDILSRLSISYFPEFILRNIGIRRSKGEFILSMSADTFPNKKIFDYALNRQFNLHSYLRAYPLNFIENNTEMILSRIDVDNYFYANQYFVNESSINELNNQLVSTASGSFQLVHWRIWNYVHGFMEIKELLHVDGLLALDIMASIPCQTLVKVIGYNYHLMHIKRNYKKIKFSIGKFRMYSRKGFISAESFCSRENWGMSNIMSLPKIVF